MLKYLWLEKTDMMYLIKKNDKYLVMASDVETIRKYCGIDAKIFF